MVNLVHPPLQADDAGTELISAVTCPGCGLLCDDVVIARNARTLRVRNTDCPKSIAFFEHASAVDKVASRIDGQAVELATAIRKAAEIIAHAQQPLIAGLATDVHGMRAVLELAEATGSTLDHMNSAAAIRNVLAVQNSGWHTTTLTEVRNRADLVLIIGGDITSRFPRFFERILWNQESMFGQDPASRDIIYIGAPEIDTAPGVSPKGIKPTVIPCGTQKLPEVIGALLAVVTGKQLSADMVAGIAVVDLQHLATRLAAARYSVIAWAAADLDFPHAELTVHQLAELIAHLNHTTRCSGLPLGGSEGDITANQVSSWISGFPVRNSYKRGYPEYDPYRFNAVNQLNMGEADALVWISSFDPSRTPPKTDAPTIVIGHSGMQLPNEPEVFIPVGIPGVDHTGIMFRCDSVVSLPLMKLRESPLPTLRQVLDSIRAELER